MKTITALQEALIIARKELGPHSWLALMIEDLLGISQRAFDECVEYSKNKI